MIKLDFYTNDNTLIYNDSYHISEFFSYLRRT